LSILTVSLTQSNTIVYRIADLELRCTWTSFHFYRAYAGAWSDDIVLYHLCPSVRCPYCVEGIVHMVKLFTAWYRRR